ncbi:MAG TPA: TonB family protein [Candidatus Dormibacteraeota bacterium]|nr:TonB family protein [Candidatus Dormibacteraeota bacterium]
MTEAWKQWEGQVVDGEFLLRQYLGGAEHGAVYLTELSPPEAKKAAIKLVPADQATAEAQLSQWRRATQLSHPHLLRVYRVGRSRLGNTDLLYVVMEHGEEDLSQILPQRALEPNEVRDMLEPILDALVYLHAKGLVHSHIKPANILAIGNQLKISADSLHRAGQSGAAGLKKGMYDPPESSTGVSSPAGDVWSLGMTLVEALTQRPPSLQNSATADPALPETLPAPFLEIARNSLRVDPARRWSVPDIAARLNQTSTKVPLPASPIIVSPVTTAPVSPVRPLSTERQQVTTRPRITVAKLGTRRSYTAPAVAAALVLIAIIGIPKLFNHRTEQPAAVSSAPEKPLAQKPTATREEPSLELKSAPKPAPVGSSQNMPESTPAAMTDKSVASQKPKAGITSTAPAALRSKSLRSESADARTGRSKKATASVSTGPRGEILDQVLPDVSQKARNTIRGKVRVNVKVHVDSSGNVANAELDSAARSKYFADQAVQASRRWEFTPPETGGRSVPSDWILRFEFSPSDTKVFPVQTNP